MGRRNAFTLLETLLVLTLVTLMISFGTVSMKRTAQLSAERHFWQEMKQNWQASQARAQTNVGATNIKYINQAIRFSWVDIRNKHQYHNDIAIPATISVVSFKPLQMLPNGYVQAGTETFHSSLTGKDYSMKVQFAWGGYYVADS